MTAPHDHPAGVRLRGIERLSGIAKVQVGLDAIERPGHPQSATESLPRNGTLTAKAGPHVMSMPKVSGKAIKRIWEDDGYRLFLSHKSEVSKEANRLKKQLSVYGVSAFVAHTSIRPTLAWQAEIENALYSMDGLAALMTKDFHESEWTDQEVGFALGRHVPTIPVRLGKNPYGFLGRIQALSSSWDTAAEDIVKLLIAYDVMFDAYLQAIRDCGSYDDANLLAGILPSIEQLDDNQVAALVDAYNSNEQVHGSYGFNGSRRYRYGHGLLPPLNRFGSQQYEMSDAPYYHIRPASVAKKKRR
jgi:hypothetical protein